MKTSKSLKISDVEIILESVSINAKITINTVSCPEMLLFITLSDLIKTKVTCREGDVSIPLETTDDIYVIEDWVLEMSHNEFETLYTEVSEYIKSHIDDINTSENCPLCGKHIQQCECFPISTTGHVYPKVEFNPDTRMMNVLIDLDNQGVDSYEMSINKIKESIYVEKSINYGEKRNPLSFLRIEIENNDNPEFIGMIPYHSNEQGVEPPFEKYGYINYNEGFEPEVFIGSRHIKLEVISPSRQHDIRAALLIPINSEGIAPNTCIVADMSRKTLSAIYFTDVNKGYFIHPSEVEDIDKYGFENKNIF